MKQIFKILLLTLGFQFALFSQEKELMGTVKLENIDQNQILVFTIDNAKYEIVGKLAPMIKSFYTNQKLKVYGNIINYQPEEIKQKKLNGKIEIKEIIVNN